jgi:hypothetical protein
MLGQPFMTGQKQRRPTGKPRIDKPSSGCSHRLLLNIKTVDMAATTNETRQQQGVMAIAAGCVHGRIPFTHKAAQKQVRKRYRSAQDSYGFAF